MPNTDISFIAPDGTTVNLNDRVNTYLAVGMEGDLMPSFSFVEQQSPAFDGAIIKDVNINARDISIPLFVQDVSRPAVLERVRSIIKSLMPKSGEGQLVINSDGKVRVLNCRYKGGFSSDGTGTHQFTYWMKTLLVFHAGNPYFYDQNDTTFEIAYAVRNTSFFPIPPMQLYNPNKFSGSGEATPTITCSGDVLTWPEIRIYGAGDNPTITNLTSGKKISIATTLEDGEVIIIDTDPVRKTVVDGQGQNLWPIVSADSSLFPLVPGDNRISIFLSNPTGNSKIQFIYKSAYLTV
jgi:phage-related protein